MSTTTCLNINTLNVNNSDSVTRNNAALIKVESMLLFSSLLVLKIFRNWMSFKNNFISFILDLHFLLFSNRLIVSNINMSIMFSLLSTMLPNMRTKNSTSSSVHNMCTCVETSQRVSSFSVNFTNNFLTNSLFCINGFAQIM